MTPDPIALPEPGQAAWPKRTESVTASAILADIPPLVTVAFPNGSTTTIHTAEQARGMTIDRVVKWHRIPKDEERAHVTSAMAAWNSPKPASPDPEGEAGKAKAPLWLLPPEAMRQAAWAHGLGAAKYRAWNWRGNKVQASTYISAMMRHIAAYLDGEDNDAETSAHAGQPVSHLANVIAFANILIDAKAHGTLIDDRPPARASRGPGVPD